jgi:hypothetical protein
MKEYYRPLPNSLKITGGEFENWYEGLSPIEKVSYGKSLNK